MSRNREMAAKPRANPENPRIPNISARMAHINAQ